MLFTKVTEINVSLGLLGLRLLSRLQISLTDVDNTVLEGTMTY